MRFTCTAVLVALAAGCGSPDRIDASHVDAFDAQFERADVAESDASDLADSVATVDAGPCGNEAVTEVPTVRAFVRDLVHGPAYTPLPTSVFDAARRMARAIAHGDVATARSEGAAIGYTVRALHSASSNTCHWLLEPGESTLPGHGWLIVPFATAARDLAIEAPHVPYDRHTDEEAAIVYEAVGARALLVAGAERCASPVNSGCRSNTECSPDGAVESDVAHSVTSAFHAFHLGVAVDAARTVAIQFHTNLSPGTNGDALVSDGTRTSSTGTGADRFADALAAATTGLPGCVDDASMTSASQSIRIRSCNAAGTTFATTPLCGTTSTQGLASNGSADACHTLTTAPSDRFVHLEQCSRQLDAVDAWADHVATAIRTVF